MGKCPVCKKPDGRDHERCKDVSKFKCDCGCDRKSTLRDLDIMRRKHNEKIKCRRKKLICEYCPKEVNILWTFRLHNSFTARCLSCMEDFAKRDTSGT